MDVISDSGSLNTQFPIRPIVLLTAMFFFPQGLTPAVDNGLLYLVRMTQSNKDANSYERYHVPLFITVPVLTTHV
jgi:hypothetical protein